ncbi:MAG: BatA domain-containing protein [Verrucomicrobiota bacterium]
MNFTFLNPWFWLGAVALAAPIWLHLRRRQEKNVHRFAALRFLDDQPEPRQSPLRLRNIILFLLRALALLAIVAGFAWPYLPENNQVIIQESRVYVLDNTLSYQAGDGFAKGKERILKELAAAGSEVQVAVVELTSQPRVLVAFGDDRASARSAVLAIVPSHQRGTYLAAFRQAGALLGNSLGHRKRIIFLGDHQDNQWSESVNTPPFLNQVEIEMDKPALETRPNLSLGEPKLQRVFLGEKSLVNFSVRLGHVGEAKTANVVIRTNGQVLGRQPVSLENQPENVLLQAQWESGVHDWLRGEVSVEGEPDALAGDNQVFFALPPLREGQVAVLAQSRYLRLALSPEVMRGQWAARILEPAKLAEELAANRDAEVLCIESGYLPNAEARKLMWRYLTNRRGVVLILNRLSPTIVAALRELGFETESAAVDAKRGESFQFVAPNHPIFHPFFAPDFGNLLEVRFTKYYRLKTSEAVPLAYSDKGSALFFQGTRTPGRLYVTAFGLDREHTSWPAHPTFIPFLDLLLQSARAEDGTPSELEPGGAVLVRVPPHSQARHAVLHDGGKELSRVPVVDGAVQLRMPDQPGNVSLSWDNPGEIERIFSVNPSPKESQLTYVNEPEALATWQLSQGLDKNKSNLAEPKIAASSAAILQQQLWWWLLVAGAGFLALETFLALFKRNPVGAVK